jgi:hypothetical protein
MRYILVLIAAVLLISAVTVNAQVSFNVSFNVDRQPVWGPTGYDHVDYYYLPDIGVYYNVPQKVYYYSDDRGNWKHGSNLPSRYRNFDLYSSYKVVVNEPEPYRNDAKYRDQYASYKGRHDQENIRDSRDSKYYVNPRHPEYKKWSKRNEQAINHQPIWGPTGYDYVEYYYLPDIGVYYNVPQKKYYYSDNRGRWSSGSSLPRRYRGFDLYSSYKVVVNESEPYRHDAKNRADYASYKGRHDQENIRDSHDSKYFVNPKHPQYKNRMMQDRQNRRDNSTQDRNNDRGGSNR